MPFLDGGGGASPALAPRMAACFTPTVSLDLPVGGCVQPRSSFSCRGQTLYASHIQRFLSCGDLDSHKPYRIRTVSRPALLLRRIAPPVWYDGMPEHTGQGFPQPKVGRCASARWRL